MYKIEFEINNTTTSKFTQKESYVVVCCGNYKLDMLQHYKSVNGSDITTFEVKSSFPIIVNILGNYKEGKIQKDYIKILRK